MSNALAVATVTQALALLIEHNLHPEIDMAVSVETRKPPADPPTDPTITVFLYQVTHNPSMRNNDLATRASDGTLLKRPAAALDLHFVISAYGEETELVGQRLIGSVVRTLHEIPVLPRELIEEAAQRPYLDGSDLAESLQRVRFTPTQMDVDETSKLWGMLHNTPYSLSVVYQASLVLLDGHQKPVPAKPVRKPDVKVLPFGAPGAPERPSPEQADDGTRTGPEGKRTGAEGTPAGTKPAGAKASDARSGAKASEATPVEARAADTKSTGAVEAKAADTKPTGAAEAKAADTKPVTHDGSTTNVRSTVAKAASSGGSRGGGARATKKAEGGGAGGRGGSASGAAPARSRTSKAAGGSKRESGDRPRTSGARRTDEAGGADTGRTDGAGPADGAARTDDGKES
ncbi:Pvc16 family protein [Streptomyces sp. Pv4-95]|uniref:Pvc16 family protein n=1 Tax=Streptomyces sp. Pv4-95 TaxID=3049543 RepID=UPI003892C580